LALIQSLLIQNTNAARLGAAFLVLSCVLLVLFARRKPREMVPVAYADAPRSELCDYWPSPCLHLTPCRSGMKTDERAPILPRMHVVQRIVMLL